MMVYNHFTGRFLPIVASFSSQPFIGISQNFQFKLAPTGNKCVIKDQRRNRVKILVLKAHLAEKNHSKMYLIC